MLYFPVLDQTGLLSASLQRQEKRDGARSSGPGNRSASNFYQNWKAPSHGILVLPVQSRRVQMQYSKCKAEDDHTRKLPIGKEIPQQQCREEL